MPMMVFLLPAYIHDQLLYLTSDKPIPDEDPVTDNLGDYYDR